MALWRKLKSLGAVYLQNGVCLLPNRPDHMRQLKILEHEITEMSGEAVLLEAAPLDPGQRTRVVERFRADRDSQYRELIERCDGFEAEIARETAAGKLTYAELEENDEDLKKLKAPSAPGCGCGILDSVPSSMRVSTRTSSPGRHYGDRIRRVWPLSRYPTDALSSSNPEIWQ